MKSILQQIADKNKERRHRLHGSPEANGVT